MSIGKAYKYGAVQTIPTNTIKASPFQVRKHYGKIKELAEDIEENGLLQPILVRPIKGEYEIVHGHRRFTAVKTLGLQYIDAFEKELTDVEAIRIQGSENLQRKQYDPIEEGILYKHYREFWKKEKGEVLKLEDIAKAFNTSNSNVEAKLGLLDLPNNVQTKIIKGDIPVRKATALITLTKEAGSSALGPRNIPGIQRERTDKYFFEIQTLADEIEKGDKGGLRTREGVERAVDLIRQGSEIGKALEDAKLTESLEIAKKQAEKGKTPEQIIGDILKSQQNPQKVIDALLDLNVEDLKKKLETGNLKCPHCGGTHCLEWGCCEEKVLPDGESSEINSSNE